MSYDDGSPLRLSAAQIRAVAVASGFVGNDLNIAVAVCQAESGGDASIVHPNNDNHSSLDCGLWQINNYWHKTDVLAINPGFWSLKAWKDPATNARAAKMIKDASGWSAWSTYTSGAYKSHMTSAGDDTVVGSTNTVTGISATNTVDTTGKNWQSYQINGVTLYDPIWKKWLNATGTPNLPAGVTPKYMSTPPFTAGFAPSGDNDKSNIWLVPKDDLSAWAGLSHKDSKGVTISSVGFGGDGKIVTYFDSGHQSGDQSSINTGAVQEQSFLGIPGIIGAGFTWLTDQFIHLFEMGLGIVLILLGVVMLAKPNIGGIVKAGAKFIK